MSRISKNKTGAMTEKEKVEERREQVLANGRKFKYPLQYAKHKLVFNTIIISVIAVVVLVVTLWVLFYKVQDTGDIVYRISKVLPVPVAEVDGAKVNFSDYLMLYRSSLRVVEQQSGQLGDGDDANAVRSEYKRNALSNAEDYTFAKKIADERGISVSDADVAEAFDEQRKVGGADRSEESFLQVISNNFGFSKEEYERLLYFSLLRASVEENIDANANNIAGEIEKVLGDEDKLAEVLEKYGEDVIYEETGGLVDNKNVDGGRANIAMALEAGAWSGKFVSNNGDGYYFVKLIEKNETQVNYASIKIPFKEFSNRLKKIREEDKIKEYIELK